MSFEFQENGKTKVGMHKTDFEAVTYSRPRFGGDYETVMHNDSALHG